jgi:hypothetical protein
MAINYLPFQRREIISVPPRKAARVLTNGFSVSNLARMATGGTKRAIVQDIIMSAQGRYTGDGVELRMRIGVDGRNYMTEDLYDYRVFPDISHPAKAMWDWSCGQKTPYRIYPGQRMKVLMQRSPFWLLNQTTCTIPMSVMFNGLKVPWGSPVGTKDGKPIMLYGTMFPPLGGGPGVSPIALNDLVDVDSPRLVCPKDSPVDLYSVTIPEFGGFGGAVGQIVYILDGNERPFWDSTTFVNMLSIAASPISFGYGGVLLDPDETIRVEIENANPTLAINANIAVTLTYRGVLEAEDGK